MHCTKQLTHREPRVRLYISTEFTIGEVIEMDVHPQFRSMFREYDIRGMVNEHELNEDSVYRIIRAYSIFLTRNGINKAVVGYDNRECSPGFADAAIKALRELGIDVTYIGLAVSPLVYYSQYLYKCEGAVMITASHNPNGWSGFKLGKGYSKTLESGDIKEIFELVTNPPEVPNAEKMGELTVTSAWENYVSEIAGRIKMGPNKPRIVIDAGNGGSGLFAFEVFHRLGCPTFQLNCDPDTSYPHYFPNPSNLKARERLREMVKHPYVKADLGIGFDGDGDRIGVIDENGNDIWSDIILAVLSKQLLEEVPGATIVYDVKCSKALEEVILQNGGKPLMWKTGHSYIKSKMHESGAELAGERSGHIFIGKHDYYGFDDALFAAAKLVEYLSHHDEKISEIVAAFPHYITSPEIKAHCDDTVKYGVIDQIIEEFKAEYPGQVNDICGARVQFEHGWGLIRASSNLPEIVIIFEADTQEHLKEIRAILKKMTLKHPEIASEWENDIE